MLLIFQEIYRDIRHKILHTCYSFDYSQKWKVSLNYLLSTLLPTMFSVTIYHTHVTTDIYIYTLFRNTVQQPQKHTHKRHSKKIKAKIRN